MKPTTDTAAPAPLPAEAPLLVDVEEAARLLSIGRTYMWVLVRRKAVHSVRLGRRVLVTRGSLERLARERLATEQPGVDVAEASPLPGLAGVRG